MSVKKVRAGALAVMIAAAGTFGVVGCASDSGSSGSSSSSESSESSDDAAAEEGDAASTESDVTEDLQAARQAVLDALEEDSSWAQVMLASDVTEPTVKYGLMVMPFVKTDAAARVTGTVNIDGGNFVIEAESAATGTTWQIDQDGNITEVTE